MHTFAQLRFFCRHFDISCKNQILVGLYNMKNMTRTLVLSAVVIVLMLVMISSDVVEAKVAELENSEQKLISREKRQLCYPTDACTKKCRDQRKRGGNCYGTSGFFYSFTCGAWNKVCTCF